ncbi:hypothetical protein VSO92_08900 [Myroides pelagicus]|uniref:hypothetical protein n=1 Tax=Myroides pelagicus TaxID=270914 RepID=UPI002DBBA24B|nr:hypothetical protein [Myroides pelagicus]MEC4114224.1 hypothetical protein [Myroides pelagicus]
MIKKGITGCVLCITMIAMGQQRDTLYVRSIDDVVSVAKQEARFYKVIQPTEQDKVVLVEDYLLNDQLIARGRAHKKTEQIIYTGERSFYNREGNKQGSYVYNEAGVCQSITSYHPISGQVYTLSLLDDKPDSGDIYDLGAVVTYKDGQEQQRVVFFQNTDKVNSITTKGKVTYFDQKANKVGEFTYTFVDGKIHPIDGEHFEYDDGVISTMERYKKGKRIYQANYDTKVKDKQLLKREVFYTDEVVSEKKMYYYNGALRVKEYYIPNQYSHELVKSDYYADDGKYIGSFDHKAQDGTEVTLYPGLVIKHITTYDHGVMLKKTSFLKDYGKRYEDVIYYKLSEVDYVRGVGKFYDSKGKLISKVAYKNGVPWQGITYVFDEGKLVESPYANGVIEGEQKTFLNYQVEPLISQRNIYKGGVLRFEKWYEQGELVQEVEYAIEDTPSVVEEMISSGKKYITYKDGLPYQGIESTEELTHIQEDVYRKGKRIETIYKAYNRLVFAKEYFLDDSKVRRIFYDESGSEVVSYTAQFERLEGSYSYTDNEGKKYSATFKKGYLVSGEVLYNYIEEDGQDDLHYIYVKRDGNQVTIKLKDIEQNQWVSEETVVTEDFVDSDVPVLSMPIDAQFLYFDSEYRFLFAD